MASSSSSSPELPVSRSAHANSSLHIDKNLRQVLEDLSSRFILNLPEVELASLERVCFQVEQAHWYYEDFVREQDPSFPTMTLKKFSNSLFHVCPLLSHWGDDHEQTFQSFLAYKTRVPVCGAIMLNEARDKCVLVKGWKATSAWSFPKGKINEQEPRHKCAVREVLEETGYDLSEQINPADVVELSIRDQSLSLYIVPNVPEDFPFETRTRKEISKISWFKLTDLPTWKRNKTVPGKFYLITPFIGPLKAFLRDHKPNSRRTRRRQNERNGIEQPASSEEDGHFDADGEDPTAAAQESSSQASSADHGDPQTPSPLYSEPMVHTTNGADDTGIQQPINMESLDPHVARLLTSLTLSVSGTGPTDVAPKTRPTAAPLPTAATGDAPASRSPSQTGTVRPSQPSRPSSVIPAVSPPNSHRRHMSQNNISSPPRSGPFMGHNATNTPNRVASTSPVARRTAVANISPYLSRASATPAIPKQMKYLTMLENVAKESERMTPKLERQALGSGNISSASSGSLYGLREESPVIYSSSSGLFNPTLPVNSQPYPAANPISSAPISDPFTVRPHTSNTFHPHYQPNLHRPSLNEDQLRGIMPVDAGRPPIGQPIGFHPAMPSNRPFAPHHPPAPAYALQQPQQYPRIHPSQSQSNLRLVPPQQMMPPMGVAEPGPLSAPPVSPTYNALPRTNAANNAHLLSILNAPGVPRPPPNALPFQNTIGSR